MAERPGPREALFGSLGLPIVGAFLTLVGWWGYTVWATVDRLESRLGSVASNVVAMQTDVTWLRRGQEKIENRLGTFEKRIDGRIDSLETRMTSVEQKLDRLIDAAFPPTVPPAHTKAPTLTPLPPKPTITAAIEPMGQPDKKRRRHR